jgi:hypothetical protein
MATRGMSAAELDNIFISKVSEKYQLNERDLKRAFSRFDTDGNGLLDLEEMKVAVRLYLNGVDDSQIQGVIDRYDINGDGKISFEEFTGLMLSRDSRITRVSSKKGVSKKSSIEEVPDDPLRPNPDARRDPVQRPSTGNDDRGGGEYTRRNDRNGRQRRINDGDDVNFVNDGKVVGRVPVYDEEAPSMRKQAWGSVPNPKPDSDLDFTDPSVLETHAQIFLAGLRGLLQKKAKELRMEGRIPDQMVVSISELTEAVASKIINRAFQKYTGVGDGRLRDQHCYVGFPDFGR